jgi:gamma-glutamylcyclotransferase (GGCT)/AIG2-like uncharacterized protein YtfP
MGYRIQGELWEVDENTLNRLDMLEGHPNWYKREFVDVSVNRFKYSAWMYIFPVIDSSMKRCTEGDYRNYITDQYYENGTIRI